MDQLLGIVKGGDDKISTMRVLSLGTVITVLAVYIAHNVVSMIGGHGYIAMSWQDVTLISAALGFKMAQTGFEGRNGSSTPEVTSDVPKDKTE